MAFYTMIKEVISDESCELSIYFNQHNDLVVVINEVDDTMTGHVIKLSKEDAIWMVKQLKDHINRL